MSFLTSPPAISSLTASANTNDDLTIWRGGERSCHERYCSHGDGKAYAQTKSVTGALAFAKEAKLLGMDDLVHKVLKALIDNKENAHQLMVLLKNIEVFELKDLNRYLMRKLSISQTSLKTTMKSGSPHAAPVRTISRKWRFSEAEKEAGATSQSRSRRVSKAGRYL